MFTLTHATSCLQTKDISILNQTCDLFCYHRWFKIPTKRLRGLGFNKGSGKQLTEEWLGNFPTLKNRVTN